LRFCQYCEFNKFAIQLARMSFEATNEGLVLAQYLHSHVAQACKITIPKYIKT